nr:MAG TPA: hypothetical protein [Caudoviricetes sp.]DAP97060.1 MAG TPA: hypothetical protein [Caudoviricetes sp.]
MTYSLISISSSSCARLATRSFFKSKGSHPETYSAKLRYKYNNHFSFEKILLYLS